MYKRTYIYMYVILQNIYKNILYFELFLTADA